MSDLPETDALRNRKANFFETPFFLAATVGVPFAAFKLLFGVLIIRDIPPQGSQGIYLQTILGLAVIAWSLIDLSMNLARMLFYLIGRESPIEYCTLEQAGRLFNRSRLFLALDTLLSFSIISFILWSGWIGNLRISESYIWYAATTLNLISVALVNLWSELQRSSGRGGRCK